MRRPLLVVLIQLAACNAAAPEPADPGPTGPGPEATPPCDPPPQVPPCDLLGLPAAPPLQLGAGEEVLVVADVDGDGQLDIITNTHLGVGFYRGLSGATFAPEIVSSIDTAPRFPYAAVVADLDGDGKRDLVVAVSEPTALIVMHGDGAGAFQPAASYPTDATNSVATGDFNGDARPDVAYAGSSTSATVTVRLNTGDGTLSAETVIAVGEYPTSVALADLDHDGALDMIVSSSATGNLNILRGNGDGTFKPRVDRATIQPPWKVVASDLNADGYPDLVVGGGSSGIAVHVNDGTGAFLDHVDYATPIFMSRTPFVIGDLDRDGKLDVVSDNLLLLAGNGDGTLKPAADTHLADGMQPLAMSDLNGDGESDVLLLGLLGRSGVSVLESNGKHGFHTSVHYDLGSSTNSVVSSDLNHDGCVDLVLSGADLRIALGKPGGMFRNPVTTSTRPGSVMVGDFDGDRIPDLLVARISNSVHLAVSLGNGDGSFRDPGPEFVFTPWVGARVAFALGDIDLDGKTDIVAIESSLMSSVSAFLSSGDGTFNKVVLDTADPGSRFDTLSVADVNGDGKTDVVAAFVSAVGPAISVTPSTSCFRCGTKLLLNLGNGAFSKVAVDQVPSAGTVADLDGDGRLDLFRVSTLRRGNGDGTFQPEVPTGIAIPATAWELVGHLVDLTGDGKLDYVVFNPQNQLPVTVYRGVGDGTFGAPSIYLGADGAGEIADINNDGRLDVVLPGDTFDVKFARCVK